MKLYFDAGTEKWVKWAKSELGKLANLRKKLGLPKLTKAFAPESGTLVWIVSSNWGDWVRITGGLRGRYLGIPAFAYRLVGNKVSVEYELDVARGGSGILDPEFGTVVDAGVNAVSATRAGVVSATMADKKGFNYVYSGSWAGRVGAQPGFGIDATVTTTYGCAPWMTNGVVSPDGLVITAPSAGGSSFFYAVSTTMDALLKDIRWDAADPENPVWVVREAIPGPLALIEAAAGVTLVKSGTTGYVASGTGTGLYVNNVIAHTSYEYAPAAGGTLILESDVTCTFGADVFTGDAYIVVVVKVIRSDTAGATFSSYFGQEYTVRRFEAEELTICYKWAVTAQEWSELGRVSIDMFTERLEGLPGTAGDGSISDAHLFPYVGGPAEWRKVVAFSQDGAQMLTWAPQECSAVSQSQLSEIIIIGNPPTPFGPGFSDATCAAVYVDAPTVVVASNGVEACDFAGPASSTTSRVWAVGTGGTYAMSPFTFDYQEAPPVTHTVFWRYPSGAATADAQVDMLGNVEALMSPDGKHLWLLDNTSDNVEAQYWYCGAKVLDAADFPARDDDLGFVGAEPGAVVALGWVQGLSMDNSGYIYGYLTVAVAADAEGYVGSSTSWGVWKPLLDAGTSIPTGKFQLVAAVATPLKDTDGTSLPGASISELILDEFYPHT